MGSEIEKITFIKKNNKCIYFHIPNEMAHWRINSFWEKEPDTLHWIDTFKPDDFFIDIGANMGMYSLYAAFFRGVKVYAFEPEALNSALLNKNIFLNKVQHKIKAYSIALSDQIALDELHISYFGEGNACHNFKNKLDCKHQAFEPHFSQGCFSLTLDELVQKKFIPLPQHIKIDVDGSEDKIIKGAQKTLQHPDVKSVLIELNTHLLSHKNIIPFMVENHFTFSQAQIDAHIGKEGAFQGIGNHLFFKKPKSDWEKIFFSFSPHNVS